MYQKFTICYQNNDFVVINKPAGISVHKDNEETGLTTQLAQQLGIKQVWLVHRLDKVTSGLLILALKREVAVTFSQLFANHQIQKTYWALATNKPRKKQGKIVGDMERSRNGAWKLCHSKQNPAITQFHSHSIEPNLRHFILQPKTGKTHQLRVAMKSLGSPILGDKLYGGGNTDRVYLHAYQLEFVYQNQPIKISCVPQKGVLWQKLDI
ncbi:MULTISPECIES: TIGR01621 family pseudouridine synthase [Pasteurellaceae]|uniref:TIGR01621 family pseudouridine synthase n=1 Tax=Pasteurella atlantica TaxID=2827233 RepID=A0AAW8CHJ1_9PAST|nr:TIGR01621 family pseudouridine synthase [Pasteurella atlantica]MBR0573444.1 TIGR01621 family pseudouridine synthase [Pasteurella atlantica]MDP8039445.1 TIGR01621 family pseudouridine synthase [Pasteurella atlantica]MDP8041536.1 TIGR01621 family pseudouridine synthase [Pasteurella atlantica]MDP8043673.1 TIGR01621 family pseudouridine synthase [Pasteurella atlantica]MDP8045830.1 TIGR01621 family pseudouridine synthase [Pasteurella atlantica]